MSESNVGDISGTLERSDAPSLFWRAAVPESAVDQTNTLVFVHGLAEHSGRYGYPFDYFAQRGWPCYALDLRGHGRSGGRRVHIRRFSDYLDDVEALLDMVRAQRPEAPIFLIGHSMGGVVSILYATERGRHLKGLVLSSPGLRAHPDSAPSSFLLFLGRIASFLTPGLHFESGLDPTFVSLNTEVVDSYRADPLVTSKVSARWATEFLSAQKRCVESAAKLALPTLVMQSGDDHLVDPDATQGWAEQLPTASAHFHLWPGFFHEMLNEPERLQVFEKIETWIQEQSA